MNRNLQRFINDHNEHNKAVRGMLARMEAQRAEDLQAEKDRHEDIFRLLSDIKGERQPNIEKETTGGKDRFTLSMVEGCCAMLRFVYSMAGRSELPAQYMYPTTKTQEALIQYIVREVLTLQGLQGPEQRHGKQKYSKGTTGEVGSDVETDSELPALDATLDTGRVSSESAASVTDLALEKNVKAFLGSKISTANRISVILTTATAEENAKNSVKSRLLDQRRRFHDHITGPVVNKWLQTCEGFETFDNSLKTLKQDPSVFRAAADIFEKDENGSRPYMDYNVHGTAFYESCIMLKRISADHTERALAQRMKAFQDSERVNKLFEKLLDHLNCNTSYADQIRDVCRQGLTFFPHQLAFVQTKIHARLEWLSHCKLFGGKSQPKSDRSHYGVYLRYIIGFSEELISIKDSELMDERNRAVNRVQVSQNREVEILGVHLLPLLKTDMKAFMKEFYGDRSLSATNAGIIQVSRAAHTQNLESRRETADVQALVRDKDRNDVMEIEQCQENGGSNMDREYVGVDDQHLSDDGRSFNDGEDYVDDLQHDSYYEEESEGSV